MAKSLIQQQKKDVNVLHGKLHHSRAMELNLTIVFKSHNNFVLGKAKKGGVIKQAVDHSKILGENLFFDISSPSTPTFGGKRSGCWSQLTVLTLHGVTFFKKIWS